MIQKLKCLLGHHERFSYEEWEKVVGKNLLERKLSEYWTLRDWIMAVDRTQDMWIRTCRHCGKKI